MDAPGLVLTLIAPGERFVVERLSKKLGVPILVRVTVPARVVGGCGVTVPALVHSSQ
jgi:hypothetical protein